MNPLTIPPAHLDLIARLFKGGDQIIMGITVNCLSMLHAAVGIATEASELERAVFHIRAARSPWAEHPGLDFANILEELGDHLFYEGALRIATDLVQMSDARELGEDALSTPTLWTSHLSTDVHSGRGPREVLCELISMHSILAGDILDVIKKHVFYRKDLNRDLLRSLLLQDCWTIREVAILLGVDEDRLRELNIAKLEKGPNARYKAGTYSDAAAQARADKKEGE